MSPDPLPPHAQAAWVGTHSAKANAVVRALLEARLLPQLPPYSAIQPEVKIGADGKSRVDFVLRLCSSGGGGAAGEQEAPSGSGDEQQQAGSGGGGPAKRRRTGAGSSAAAAAAAAKALAAAAAADPIQFCFLEVKSVTLAEDRPGVS